MREDREKYTDGFRAYYEQINKIVDAYAPHASRSFTEKTLRNYLKQTYETQHLYLIQVLDAYIQIVNPEIRRLFFSNAYIENVGNTIADFINPNSNPDLELENNESHWCGIYVFKTPAIDIIRKPKQYFVVKRSSSKRFLLCFAFWFTSRVPTLTLNGLPLKLNAGIVVPVRHGAYIAIRDTAFGQGQIGHLHAIFDENKLAKNIHASLLHPLMNSPGEITTISADRLEDATEESKIFKIVENFGDVF